MPKILLIQGANMNILGVRQPEVYGKTTAAELDRMLLDYAKKKTLTWKSSIPTPKGNALTESSKPTVIKWMPW